MTTPQQRPSQDRANAERDAPPGAGETHSPREIASDVLLHGERELHIRHEGELYRLRVTRNGKLILHK